VELMDSQVLVRGGIDMAVDGADPMRQFDMEIAQ
jgi:hypothetical protein